MYANVVKEEAAEMFARIDEDGDRNISFEEFSRLLREMDHARTSAELRASFDTIDRNQDGRVSFDEFCEWVAR